MYQESIKHIHLEPTSDCNARCPQCPRTYYHSLETHPLLDSDYWDPEELENVLADPLFSEVGFVLINGNFGDIVMHPKPKELLEVLFNRKMRVTIYTNGGALKEDFWSWLGTKEGVSVHFGIDGLADTHHLYRRNTQFETVLRNATAFIKSGGRATWTMTLFKHNKHQIIEAKALAKKLNFAQFKERPSTRNPNQRVSCVDRNFNHEYFLEPVEGEITKNDMTFSSDTYKKGLENFGEVFSIDTYQHDRVKNTEIECRVNSGAGVFFSYDKRLLPCCFLGMAQDYASKNLEKNNFLKIYSELFEKDVNFNKLTVHEPSKVWDSLEEFKPIEATWGTDDPCTSCFFYCTKDSDFGEQREKTVHSSLKQDKSFFQNVTKLWNNIFS